MLEHETCVLVEALRQEGVLLRHQSQLEVREVAVSVEARWKVCSRCGCSLHLVELRRVLERLERSYVDFWYCFWLLLLLLVVFGVGGRCVVVVVVVEVGVVFGCMLEETIEFRESLIASVAVVVVLPFQLAERSAAAQFWTIECVVSCRLIRRFCKYILQLTTWKKLNSLVEIKQETNTVTTNHL